MSSNFFGGLESGIRFPATQINQGGPLPGAPYAGLDGRINATNSLLDNVVPYAQEKAGAMGSDRNYQQIPHRMQHVVPMLFLPSANTNDSCSVSHPVDFGDIAFSLCSNNVMTLMCSNQRARQMLRAPARNVFCNLCTVNYILAGFQRLQHHDKGAWASLADDMSYDYKTGDKLSQLLRLLQTRIFPYGIVQASEKQGGQHEATLAPVQAAANFVVTMTVDGQNRDLTNLWRDSHIGAGDQLILVLEKRPTQKYVLNHYYKQMTHQTFPDSEECWQLIPRTFRMAEEQRYAHEPAYHDTKAYDYRCNGYWRLAQSFQHRAPMHDARNYADDTVFLRGQLLQVTFAPTWVQYEPVQSLRYVSWTQPSMESRNVSRDDDAWLDAFEKNESFEPSKKNRIHGHGISGSGPKKSQDRTNIVKQSPDQDTENKNGERQRKTFLDAGKMSLAPTPGRTSQPQVPQQDKPALTTTAQGATTVKPAEAQRTHAVAKPQTEAILCAGNGNVLVSSQEVEPMAKTDGKMPVADRHTVKTAAVAETPAEATSTKGVSTNAGAQQASKIKVVKRR